MTPSASTVTGLTNEWHGRYEEVDCPICGIGADFRELLRAHDWYFRRAEQFALRQCGSCGLVYVSPRPRVQYLGDYYPDDYPAHMPPPPRQPPSKDSWRSQIRQASLAACLGYPNSGEKPWMRRPARLLRARVQRSGYPPWRPHGTVIDVGCGRGDYLLSLQRLGWDVYGIDLSPRAIRATRDNGIPAWQGRLVSLDWPGSSVDAISFFDSFEHHPDPVETLHAATRLLRPGGALLIRFPNFNAPWRFIFGRYWADISVPRHLYHFTPRTLRQMVEHCGFEVDSILAVRSQEFSRSLNVWEGARARHPVPLRRWAQALDPLLSFGHCLLRAHRR